MTLTAQQILARGCARHRWYKARRATKRDCLHCLGMWLARCTLEGKC